MVLRDALRGPKRSSTTAQAGSVLAVFIWGIFGILRCCKRGSYALLPEIWDASLWPLHIAAFFFFVQFLLCGRIAIALRSLSTSMSARQRGLVSLHQISRMMIALACSGLLSGSYYGIILGHRSWLMLQGRCLLWAVSASHQLCVSAWLHTCASSHEVVGVIIPASACMVLGFVSYSLQAPSHFFALTPVGPSQVCYTVACLCMVTAFKRLFALEKEPRMASSRRTVFRCTVLLWTAYPVVDIMRSMGLITDWQHQIFALTFLDVSSKTFLLLSMFSFPLLHLLVGCMGHLSFVQATTDVSVSVDADWCLLEEALHARAGTDFLTDFVHTDVQRSALLIAARQADEQTNIMATKVVVTLKMDPDGSRLVDAECMVSRSLFGQRHLALALLQASFADEAAGLQCTEPPDISGGACTWVGEQALPLPSIRSPWVDQEQTDFGSPQARQIRHWSMAARMWAHRALAPAARPSAFLEQACLNFLREVLAQRFEVFSSVSRDGSAFQQWDQLWGCLEAVGNMPARGRDLQGSEVSIFVSVVAVLGVHLWPWLGRSIIIQASQPFNVFHPNGSAASWDETLMTTHTEV
mmetsp:Transcript_176518/g.565967  ORF Transcript_176518/g.565967 Transcript_176518/m.565967 type:complete len:582 (+) Transcript_176518:40-1785(+)